MFHDSVIKNNLFIRVYQSFRHTSMDRDTKTNLYMIGLLGIVLISLTVIFARNIVAGASTADKPEEQTLVGSSGHVSKQIASLIDVCWKKNKKGDSETLEDCYNIELNLQDPYGIEKELIVNYLEMDERNFEMPEKIDKQSESLEIRYLPDNVSKIMLIH